MSQGPFDDDGCRASSIFLWLPRNVAATRGNRRPIKNLSHVTRTLRVVIVVCRRSLRSLRRSNLPRFLVISIESGNCPLTDAVAPSLRNVGVSRTLDALLWVL